MWKSNAWSILSTFQFAAFYLPHLPARQHGWTYKLLRGVMFQIPILCVSPSLSKACSFTLGWTWNLPPKSPTTSFPLHPNPYPHFSIVPAEVSHHNHLQYCQSSQPTTPVLGWYLPGLFYTLAPFPVIISLTIEYHANLMGKKLYI